MTVFLLGLQRCRHWSPDRHFSDDHTLTSPPRSGENTISSRNITPAMLELIVT
jgi:hypothetical protein